MTAPAALPIGLVKGMPSETYHSDPGVSNSMLSTMNKSPAHCYALHLDPDRPQSEPTAAMAAGTLAHAAILEPETLVQRYVVKPKDIDYRTSVGKAWRDAQTADIVDAEQLLTAQAQRKAFLRVTALKNLMSSGDAETSAFAIDKATGVRVRARPDFLHWTGPKRATVLDVKTINDLTTDAIQRSIASYGYHRQAAHYCKVLRACGIEVDDFVFGFVSGSYPFLAAAYVLDDESMQQGREEVDELLDLYANCQKRGVWPAFGDGYQLASLPKWAKRSSETEVSYV
jgi:exodeoxyribonuclease VIII